MIVADFRDIDGNWVSRYTFGRDRIFTRSGLLYHGMRQRTNPEGNVQKTQECYRGCYHTFEGFQQFVEWCHAQVGFDVGFHLDKDLLNKGNKAYSPETCVFLPREINTVLTKRERDRGPYPIGVSIDKHGIRARCSKLGDRDSKFLGYFPTIEDAFLAYKKYKENVIKDLANKWCDQIDPRAYEALMNYQVEITD